MYKEIKLNGKEQDSLLTELLFEIAVARADGVQLVRFNLAPADEQIEEKQIKRTVDKLIKQLKKMKSEGRIQFYATESDFLDSTTKANFLVNKYPSVFASQPEKVCEMPFVYVRI